jgi:DNA-binding GntR family transcriptional regulator
MKAPLRRHFKTSRGPLREALQALGEQGLISFARKPRRLRPPHGPGRSRELYDLRAALDDEVGRKLAGALTEEQVAALEALLREMDANVKGKDVATYYVNNLRFHDLLVRYAGNRRLAEIYRRVIKELHLFRLGGLYAGGAAISNVEHTYILRAIQTGDADGAGQAMRSHVEAARIRMRKAVQAAARRK